MSSLIDDPARFEGVWVVGIDEHVWLHNHKGDKYVTVVIDLTPTRARPATDAPSWRSIRPAPRTTGSDKKARDIPTCVCATRS